QRRVPRQSVPGSGRPAGRPDAESPPAARLPFPSQGGAPPDASASAAPGIGSRNPPPSAGPTPAPRHYDKRQPANDPWGTDGRLPRSDAAAPNSGASPPPESRPATPAAP